MGTPRDSFDFESRHVQGTILKISPMYHFFPFGRGLISNALGLIVMFLFSVDTVVSEVVLKQYVLFRCN